VTQTPHLQSVRPASNGLATTESYAMPPTSRPSEALSLDHAPPIVRGIQLIPIYKLSDKVREVFPHQLFNAVQSKCFDAIYHSDDNMVASAPTGSGKTALLELAICRLVEQERSGSFKIVYQAPLKSLCSERMRDWEKKFRHVGLTVAELTGDTGSRAMNMVGKADIIVTTPEKWDSITRKWSDHGKLVDMVKLFLIDEVHILKDTRGATLEAVVSRMKIKNRDVRFVALSATVPNSQDIAVWLGRTPKQEHIPAVIETFGEEFRPVKLQKFVYGQDQKGMNDFQFEKVLDGKLPPLIAKHTAGKPIMVFCFTRKSCETTAAMLAEWWTRQKASGRAWNAPKGPSPKISNKGLQQLVSCGVAYHHAGLEQSDRLAVENGYLQGDINVICCTSTLAAGVNLPCHLVVLKGTIGYQDGVAKELADLEVMQMLGRAGRPQFDDTAVAIILTRKDQEERYKQMVSGQEVLESTLHLNLIEHLNSEISLGTVRSVATAKEWLKSTFLAVRMKQNTNHYRIKGVSDTRNVDEKLENVCERDLNLLRDEGLISQGNDFSSTQYGHAMSKYMIPFETMKTLLTIPAKAKTEEIVSFRLPRLMCMAC
jgi:ATP-dependent DNA helicase HFM1/MER3